MNTQIIELDINGLAVTLNTIDNVSSLYDALIAKGEEHEDVRDERIPYWADLWPSAIGLSRYLVNSGIIVNGMQVHEMGCGLGLPGIIAGKLGAQVVFSDYMDDALDFCRRNWLLNNTRNAGFIKMDWRNPGCSPVDVLLASDVAYERRSFEFLPGAFRKFLKPDGVAIVSEPNRLYAREFFDSLQFQNFRVKKFNDKVYFKEVLYSINVFELRLL